MDATGIGKPVYENLHSKLGDRLEGVVFTPEEKEIMAIEVKRGLEQREFLLSNDKEFHRQIHSIRRTSTGGKYFRYDAERNEKGHADSFWAWALANSAVGTTDKKNSNFYAQRRQKRIELMNENAVQNSTPIIQTKETIITNSQNTIDKVEMPIIRKGKSLRQINAGFRYEKPDKNKW